MLCSALLITSTLIFQSDEMVKDFKKFYKKEKDPAMKVELIYSLEGEESIEIAEVLMPILDDDQSDAVKAARQVLAGFTDHLNRVPMLEVVNKDKKHAV
ncbi:MAG: hypothetical protein QGF46_07540, partial [Planctomycetota bacterium]|nr:hypothetical protein [Planctomycetota bacterium]